MIRYVQDAYHPNPRLSTMTILQTESEDGGKTWTAPWPAIRHGGPPHLMRHSSGVLICTYGYRETPFGQRVMLSGDDGKTWETDYILRDDGPDRDLGYPGSVEMPDGTIFSVYYQKIADATEKCSLLWSRWELPVLAAH
jgi:sialidase-1